MSAAHLVAQLTESRAWRGLRQRAALVDWAAVGRTAVMVIVAAYLLTKAWEYGGWVATKGSIPRILAFALLAAAVGVMLVFLGSWRAGIYPFLLWLIFEDLPRKFLGNNLLIYLGKDVLVTTLYVAFLGAFFRGRLRLFRPPFLMPLLLFFWFALLQSFNPNTPSLLYSVLGMKLYFYYVPLMFVGYALIRTEQDLHRFLVFNLAIGGFVATLGIMQVMFGMDFLNPAQLASEIAGLSALVRTTASGGYFARPSAIFVSDGRFAWYVLMMFLLGMGAFGYKLLRGDRRWKLIFVGFSLCAAGLLLSGSRGSVAYGVVSTACIIAIFFAAEPPGSRGRVWLARALRRAAVAAIAVVAAVTVFFPSRVLTPLGYYWDTMTPWGANTELFYRAVRYPIESLFKAGGFENWFLGNGTGTAGLGTQYIQEVFGKQRFHGWVESGWGTLILEMGVLAPLFWVAWTVALIYHGARVVRGLVGTPFFPLGLTMLWFAFILLGPLSFFGLQPYQNYLLNAFLWLLTGILFKLPVLARESVPATRVVGGSPGVAPPRRSEPENAGGQHD